jgi:hypothetical protein
MERYLQFNQAVTLRQEPGKKIRTDVNNSPRKTGTFPY